MKRRQVIQAGLHSCLLTCIAAPGVVCAQGLADPRPARVLTFGTTPVFLDDQAGFLARWAAYLESTVGMPVQFVRRRSYRDIMALLRAQEVDAAWICGYPWVVNRTFLRGLAMPMYHDEPWYQSYLIVPSSDHSTGDLRDLAQRIYAYSDPDSNSGYLVPRTTLIRESIDPDHHFSRSFFTWGHRNVVSAVAAGLSAGGSVDGYVWDTLEQVAPSLTQQTRVAWRSAQYGFPPLVVRAGLPADIEERLRASLFGMSSSSDGQRLLKELNLTAFGPFRPEYFDGIAQLVALASARTP